jgi:plasmid stabilization system protein ParE
MASKKVEFHEEAALESEAALEWYLERSLLAASKFDDALNRAMDMIVEVPPAGPPAVAAHVDFFYNGFRLQSFIANFRRQSKWWRLHHARRKPGYWKQRL